MNEDARKKAIDALVNRPSGRLMLVTIIGHYLDTLLEDAPPEKRGRLEAIRDACRKRADALSYDGIRDLYQRAAAKPLAHRVLATVDPAEILARGGRQLSVEEHREHLLADPILALGASFACALVDEGSAEAWLVDGVVLYVPPENDGH